MDRLGREIADNTIEMIIVFNEAGDILFANRTASLELGYEEGLEGVNIKRIMRQQFKGEDSEKGFTAEDIIDVKETSLYRKNESCFPAQIRVLPSEITSGLFQLLGVNITKQQEQERQLVRVQEEAAAAMKARNEFVANVTHELRTPLNGIRGHMTTLRGSELNEEQRRTTDIIMQCCENMAAIINNILDFSKLEAGKFTIEQKEFQFREMLNHVIDVSITAINEKGLHLIVNVADDIPDLMVGDRLRIEQVLNNLLSNAVKFTSLGYISLEVTKTMEFDNEIELFFMVRDTGIGISREEQDRIFKSFSQVDASITRKYGGTGLGLVITKQLVELMGGSINLESERGKGSTFSFSLRLYKATTEEMVEEEKQESVLLFNQNATDITKFDRMENYFTFGTPENAQEIRNKMEKLVICLELGAWDRAEAFAANIKSLLDNQETLKKAVFRLEMCLRKEDYEKSMQRYQSLKDMLEEEIGGV